MPSLTWIDHDAEARERSLRILALSQERESRDELGLGGVRDSFADRLFPGTSTIQTRLRYMLFVPLSPPSDLELAYLANHLPENDSDRLIDQLRINLEPPGQTAGATASPGDPM